MKTKSMIQLCLVSAVSLMLHATPVIAEAAKTDKPAGEKVSPSSDGYAVSSKTNIDFSEAKIEGQFRAPQGFFLQGKQGQSMSQMVRLRSNFRSELRSSKSGVRAIIK